jgi:hypothetical protein
MYKQEGKKPCEGKTETIDEPANMLRLKKIWTIETPYGNTMVLLVPNINATLFTTIPIAGTNLNIPTAYCQTFGKVCEVPSTDYIIRIIIMIQNNTAWHR